MDTIREGLLAILEADYPMTVRQVFYRAVSAGLVDKTEAEYKTTVGRLLIEMRRSNQLPYNWIADNSRWMRKPRTHDSLEAALEDTARTYRRAVWRDQADYVELWCEKDALAGVLFPITSRWDVPLMVTRGYPSITYLYEAAGNITDIGKSTTIYYIGDHDPSGQDIERFARTQLREMASRVEITFMRLAVTPSQIELWDLPLRPTKKTDSRASGFKGGSVEADAIHPAKLKEIVENAITSHIDPDVYARMCEIEQAERTSLMQIARWAA